MHKHLAICHVIASVVSADQAIAIEEMAILEEAMDDLGLTAEERQSVLSFKNEGAEEVVAGMPEADKLNLRDGLVAAARADGKITPQETAIIERITALMGL